MKFKWLVLSVVASVGLFVDWYTKYLAATHLQQGVAVPVIGNVLEFLLVYNRNAIFGLNPRTVAPWFPLNGFFLVFSLLASVVLVIYYAKLPRADRLVHWGIAMIMPGALGNFVDRVFRARQGVVDFIKVDLNVWPLDPWPIFNMADAYVTVGVCLILLSFILEELRRKKAVTVPVATASEPAENDSGAHGS